MADDFDRVRAALSDVYAIDREIGRGGMATVYLAEDLKHGRTVAIKVLRPELAHSIGGQRFLREIEIAASLTHPHVLSMHDSGDADGLLYYVMPYISGETLRHRLERERHFTIEDAIRITTEIAEGLHYAHDAGVLHRDIKPENVLFSGDHALIADFGIGRALGAAGSGGDTLTRTGHRDRHADLHESRAGGGRTGGRAERRVRAGVRAVRDAGGDPAVHGSDAAGGDGSSCAGPGAGPDDGAVDGAGGRDRGGRAGDGEGAGGSVPLCGSFRGGTGEGRREAKTQQREASPLGMGGRCLDRARGGRGLHGGRSVGPGGERGATPDSSASFEITGAELPDTGLALGLFAEVTEGLRESGLSALPVEAVRDYRITHGVVEEVAADLDLDIVWLTRLRAWGDHAHVRVDLVDARSQASLEATLIVVPMSDLSEVAPRLVTWASRVLAPSDSAPPYEPHPEARRAFDRARRAWEAGEVLMADSLLGEVQDIDPEYPRAKGMNALLTVQFVHPHPGGPPSCEKAPALIPLAKQSAEEALALDLTLALPHVALGHALWEHEFDWTGGEAELLAALQLDPDQPDANYFYGAYLMTAGRMDEAWEYYSGTVESNLSARRYQYFLNRLADLTGHLADAEQTLRRAAILFNTEARGSDDLIANLREQGRIDEAIELLLETGADTVANPLDDNVRWAIARGSDEAVDRHIAQRVERGSFHSAARIALLAGRYDLSMEYLQRWWPSELACPSLGRVWLLVDFPGLADRPQFQEMMDVAGIPWREYTVWAEMSD